jgi:cytochrome c peroxidase
VTGVFVNLGKAIAAYERRIQYGPSRLDMYLFEWKRRGTTPRHLLNDDELAGFALFQGKANCIQCHNGPLFTNNEFHNTGVPVRAGLPADHGRSAAIPGLKADEFNCRSKWSDARPEDCGELDFLPPPSLALARAYKVPSLRNVAARPPYMHAGQFATLAEVLHHYNRAPASPAGRSELKPLGLTPTEMGQIEAFLKSLNGGISAPRRYLAAPTTPQ